MNAKLLSAAMAFAGTILDEKVPNETRLTILGGMRDSIQLSATALALASTEENKESNEEKYGTSIFPDRSNPAEILRMMADAWEEQLLEDWDNLIQTYRDFESEYQTEELTKNLPEELTVKDIFEMGGNNE